MRSADDEDLGCCSNSHLLCRETSNLSNVSTTSSINNNERSLLIATYRPVKCPIPDCTGVLSPSTMIAHFEYMHRDITTIILDISNSQSCVSVNISMQYYKLQPSQPAVVNIILIEGISSELIPLLLNMTLLPRIECRKSEILINNDCSSEWLVIWLSSLHLFPFLFTLTLQSYGLPRYTFSQQCSPKLLHEHRIQFNRLAPIPDSGTMLLNTSSLEKLSQTEMGLYVEVKLMS